MRPTDDQFRAVARKYLGGNATVEEHGQVMRDASGGAFVACYVFVASWVAEEAAAVQAGEHDAACPDHDHPPGHCRRPDLKPAETSDADVNEWGA